MPGVNGSRDPFYDSTPYPVPVLLVVLMVSVGESLRPLPWSTINELVACGLMTFPGRVSVILSVCSIKDKQTKAQLNKYWAGKDPCFATAPCGTSEKSFHKKYKI